MSLPRVVSLRPAIQALIVMALVSVAASISPGEWGSNNGRVLAANPVTSSIVVIRTKEETGVQQLFVSDEEFSVNGMLRLVASAGWELKRGEGPVKNYVMGPRLDQYTSHDDYPDVARYARAWKKVVEAITEQPNSELTDEATFHYNGWVNVIASGPQCGNKNGPTGCYFKPDFPPDRPPVLPKLPSFDPLPLFDDSA